MVCQLADLSTISSQPEAMLAARGIKRMLQKLGLTKAKILPAKGKLQLQVDSKLKAAFNISIGEVITISGSSEKAVFQAGMHLINLITTKQLAENNSTVKLPAQPNTLMVDIGRKHFSLKALKQLTDELALFQFDTLQLHFSENFGFRIESEQHPEIVSERHLSKAEVRELIQYAQAYFIDIIPDFDSPGHMEHILKHYPEWCLEMLDEDGKKTRNPRALDILNEDAVAFMKSIYKEYAELFQDSRYFHIGADEFVPFDEVERYPSLKEYAVQQYGPNASGIETFIEYVNDIIAYVRDLGFIPMVWNDGFYRRNRQEELHLAKDCVVCYWTCWNKNMASLEDYLTRDYHLVNYNDNYLYYVLGENASYTYPEYEKIKASWQPQLFAGEQLLSADNVTQLDSAAVAIWADIPEAKSESEVIEDMFFVLAAAMQKILALDLGAKDTFSTLYESYFSHHLTKINEI